MNIIVAGPTGSGKSTLLQTGRAQEFLPPSTPIPNNTAFGYELEKKDIPENVFIHYNLLRPASLPTASALWEFNCDPVFRKIISDPLLGYAIVLVSPIAELLERAGERTIVEENVSRKIPYDAAFWRNIIGKTNIFNAYEALFNIFDEKKLPYTVVYSSPNISQNFRVSDRVFVPRNLRGEFIEPPAMEAIQAILSMPGCHYQSVLLPRQVVTDKRAYTHIKEGGRQETFNKILNEKMKDESVLDIGCALGDLLFRAERLGADRLVGIELHQERFEAATAIGRLLHSRAVIHQCDFMDFNDNEGFDHVFVLNVVHHVWNFYAFLEKACRLAKKSLTVEFPTLGDSVFAHVNGYPLPDNINKLPLIGISSKRASQTFVFSPKAMERICFEEIGGFARRSLMASPLSNRYIMVFEK